MNGLLSLWRLFAVLILGFASGLPLALTGQAMQAWMSAEHVDVATIGFLSLVGLPYTFKFLWAPLMDRFELPLLGRRRGWMVLTQLAMAGTLFAMAGTSPSAATRVFALLAVLTAFLSASQDVVIDAYRTDLLSSAERGLGSSIAVLGYRLAMIVSGGVVMIWTDPSNAGSASGWSWPEVYRLMAGFMVAAAAVSALVVPRLRHAPIPTSLARNDLLGFVAVVAAVIVGVVLTDQVITPLTHALLRGPLQATSLSAALQAKWIELAALLLGMTLTVPLAGWAARAARFETFLGGLRSYFAQPGAKPFLAFVVLYKLGDAFALSLLTPFLLQAMHFSSAEVGVVNKVMGLWLTIAGALAGGALMMRLGLWRSLLLFGLIQMLGNLGFWWLAVHGMGTAAFLAFLMSLCNHRFTATQFALLSAFSSVGRVWVGPLAGVLAETIGWPTFFLLSIVVALPALALLWWLKPQVRALEVEPEAASAAA